MENVPIQVVKVPKAGSNCIFLVKMVTLRYGMQIKQMHQSLIDLDVMIDDVMAVIGVPID
jgi:hypothetical protein